MSRCKKCNVEILDNTEKCPLCHHVLEQGEYSGENMYPNARVAGRQYRLLENIILFASIVIWCICFSINFAHNRATGGESWWSLVLGLGLIYVNGILRFTILGKSDYTFKLIITIVMAVAILLEVDWLTGDHGWGKNFVLPAAILCLDIGIGILMIVNRKNWQSYIMLQILALLLSVVSLILVYIGVITFPYLAAVAAAVSLFLFPGNSDYRGSEGKRGTEKTFSCMMDEDEMGTEKVNRKENGPYAVATQSTARGRVLKDLIFWFNNDLSIGKKVKSGELRKKIVKVEPEWKVPEAYNLTHIDTDHFSMKLLSLKSNPNLDKVILQLHGGGYIGAIRNIYYDFAVYYSERSKGASILCPDYRVAPEDPYPAALEDAVCSYRWLIWQPLLRRWNRLFWQEIPPAADLPWH